MEQTFKIGTRGSPLALTQARLVQDALLKHHADLKIEIVPIKTTGDRIQDTSLSEAGGKGLFTKEIEEALLSGDIDCAVHSMKDMPTVLPDGLSIPCVLPRSDARDVLISPHGNTLNDIPNGATIGTASLRRETFLKNKRPDLKIVLFRGNVNTRLKKMDDGVVDGTLLAAAGLKRLGMDDLLSGTLSVDDMIPAVAQGIIGIEVRDNDTRTRDLLSVINCPVTILQTRAERAFLHDMDGSCRTPIAGYMTAPDTQNNVTFYAMVADKDGSNMKTMHDTATITNTNDAIQLGHAMAQKFKNQS